MNDYFRIGDHLIGGLSLTYYKSIKSYMLLMTIFFVHFSLTFKKYDFRLGFSVGNSEINMKFSIGYNA